MSAGAQEKNIYTISEITATIKNLLENSLDDFAVKGEVSNVHQAASGHIYFSLKDDKASISVALFRGSHTTIKAPIKNGTEVVVQGRISVYPPRGSYQIIAQSVEEIGAGSLQAQFEALKKKLHEEGLFDEKNKKELPSMPRKIAVITSPSAAAIQDVLTVLKRRYSAVEVLVIPSLVQGDAADTHIIKALDIANDKRVGADLILLTRGGGSLEDLWCFNSEKLARAIFKSKLPVVSAVGHEVDFTIADFVADLRAATPSAAAELIVKEQDALLEEIENLEDDLIKDFFNYIKNKVMALDMLTIKLKNPKDKITDLQAHFTETLQRVKTTMLNRIKTLKEMDYYTELNKSMLRSIEKKKNELDMSLAKINSLSPLKVLDRGYSLVYSKAGKLVKSAKECSIGDEIKVRMHRGELYAEVNRN